MERTFSFERNVGGFSVKVYEYGQNYHLQIEDQYIGVVPVIDYSAAENKRTHANGYNYEIHFAELSELQAIVGSEAKEFWEELSYEHHLYQYDNLYLRDDIERYFKNKEIANWLFVKLNSMINENEYADNYRFALAGDSITTALYEYRAKKGCCGSIDEETICPIDGNKYYIGCNFGH